MLVQVKKTREQLYNMHRDVLSIYFDLELKQMLQVFYRKIPTRINFRAINFVYLIIQNTNFLVA